jgi:tRNA nucleotidyltransferase (CCA-adding enzyme)
VRVAALLRVLQPDAIEALSARLRLPANCRDLALLASRHGNTLADAAALDGQELFEVMDAADAWRRPERFCELVEAALAGEAEAAPARARLLRAHRAALAVDAGAVARAQSGADAIKAAVAAARLDAIRNSIK